MIEKVNSNANIQAMLATLRAHQAQAAGGAAALEPPATEKPDFGESVKSLLTQVNEAQVKARNMAEAYERGEDVPLTDVVLAMQKSSLSFEATLQVRN
ncbi:MAG: flagellar hook-basal body complex protein FliE, partial [Betaproteobacteria bacterium]